jgi:hypothetical protein
MNLWFEFDNCHSVAQMVIALNRHRRVTGLTPARVPIHVAAFYANGLDFGQNNIIWLVQCCAYHRKKFHHHCIQNHTSMYKILLCCYMLHRRRMLSVRDIRSRLNEIYMRFWTNRTRYLQAEITSGIFITFVTPIPKTALKIPTYGSEIAVQRSNQLRHRETVVELSPDVHA